MLCSLLALVFGACRQVVSPDVAATVNGRPITSAEVDRLLATQVPNAQSKSDDDQVKELKLEMLAALD